MMNKDDLIKKHRIVKITSIILMISGFSTYFILGFLRYFIAPTYILMISRFLTYFIVPIYMFYFSFPFSASLASLYLSLLFILLLIVFPFIFTFAIYKTIFPLTKKSMLTLMDENALLQNLKMIRDKFFNLFLIFFLFAPLISIILIIVVYLYLAITLKYYNTQPTIESFKS